MQLEGNENVEVVKKQMGATEKMYDLEIKRLRANDMSCARHQRGISYVGTLPLLNKYTGKNLVILASAWNVWDDWHRFKAVSGKAYSWDIMVINDMGLYFPGRFTHWISLHPSNFSLYRQYCIKNCHTHSREPAPFVDYAWYIYNRSGSGGMFALKVATLMGYNKIILCGMPLTNGKRFFDQYNMQHSFDCSTIRDPWKEQKDIFEEFTRSMSGYTKELFGEPTKEWLEKS